MLSIRNLVQRNILFILLLSLLFFLFSCASHKPVVVEKLSNPQLVQSGRKLARGLAACGFCHGEKANPESLLIGGRGC